MFSSMRVRHFGPASVLGSGVQRSPLFALVERDRLELDLRELQPREWVRRHQRRALVHGGGVQAAHQVHGRAHCLRAQLRHLVVTGDDVTPAVTGAPGRAEPRDPLLGFHPGDSSHGPVRPLGLAIVRHSEPSLAAVGASTRRAADRLLRHSPTLMSPARRSPRASQLAMVQVFRDAIAWNLIPAACMKAGRPDQGGDLGQPLGAQPGSVQPRQPGPACQPRRSAGS